MIVFEKKPEPPKAAVAAPVPPAVEVEENRAERASKKAADRSRKSDTDGARRRSKQTADDNRLL